MSRLDKKDAKSINIKQVVSYLNHSFAKMADEVFASRAAVKGTPEKTKSGIWQCPKTPLYTFQVKHCYFVDEIERGPTYMLPKVIGYANDNIAAMEEEKKNDERSNSARNG